MTVFDSFPHLREPSPLTDADRTLDDVASVSPGPGPSTVRLEFSSGQIADLRVSEDEGALRLRSGADRGRSSLLIDHDSQPVTVEPVHDGVWIVARDWDATWTVRDGLVVGAFRTAPTSGLGGTQPALFGRYLSDGSPIGWLVSTRLRDGESVFGGGESFRSVDHRGTIRRGINVETHGIGGLDAVYLNVPFYWSLPATTGPGWALLAHTGGPVVVDIGATHGDVAAFATDGEDLDLLVFGGTPLECIATYHRLSGRPGAMPDWAFGTWSSRCSYFDEDELHAIVDGYEAAGVPLDVVHVDCWADGNAIKDLTCTWEIDRERFPLGWVARLADRGVRVSLWHNPYVLAGSPLARRLEDDGLLLVDAAGTPCRTPDKSDRVIIDLTNPGAVAWWQANIARLVTDEGAVAFKPDFAEEIPLDAVAADGRTGRQIRNEYSVLYQRATHEVLASYHDGAAALFCRSGTTGAQRFPCHWVGDTPSTWTGLVQALRACLSLSLSGFGVVTSDAGGFFADESWDRMFAAADAEDGSLYEADVEGDLFLRWTQWAAFSPVLRFHGTGRREPWAYPDPIAALAGDAVRIRHRLRPYLETVATTSATDGVPMMRPPALTDPQVPGAAASLQYLLGDDVLVAPLAEAAGTRRVFVPDGQWLPVLGLEPVAGRAWVNVACDLEQFPVWVRADSLAADLLAE